MKPIDVLRGTDLSSAKTIQQIATACKGGEYTIDGSVSQVLIQPITKGIWFTDTGTSPDISDLTDATKVPGIFVAAGAMFLYDGDCTKLRFIQSEATATLNLALYSNLGI